ncbi:molybdopterin-dependent oxidoreductase [Agrobacterium rhizogenes]|uniref:molybdopterin cofactor-binding domain-containing protein n=1 Tax=Rhizobium rhizogenes TaxID=359 RepID=UPI00115C8CE1|nr:molybdopterin cofactor-binding domain-containing protein [Rhizobium rhizogenes]NTF52641.1 molybdopterin-dependent oxidoreductase [Rhizobium rhizogenes]NTF65650.1 molybdopterin-dependent oxidoreductase [Rhizobium rhizogenes]NTG04654.1 molybdopterin-dependent oxidoreductase [Rhizobium rhizogenes]NTG11756.1 molybdopterin-dependent oxidoreductase [Rhizobium rhizogenes]NTG18185.1 molybdopterin-dependent oxidoreductase [Rhizobium rhizogenes]
MPNPNSTLQFYLNGETVVIENPSPSALLVDYLRSPEVRLTGTKKPCGQGGCGGCTVILSDWPNGQTRSRAINSCLRRLCSLNGMAITTIEGTGGLPTDIAVYPAHHPTASRFAPPVNAPLPLNLLEEVKTVGAYVLPDGSHVNPVAYSLATNNGSQCGYCSVGFVMNMSEFIANHPQATKKEIEGIFDGNLCRCTGYRPILTAMETWASDWSAADDENRIKCLQDHPLSNVPKTMTLPDPGTPLSGPPLWMQGTGIEWFAPSNIADAETIDLTLRNQGKNFRLVHGGTSYGIYKSEFAEVDAFIDLAGVAELHGDIANRSNYLYIPAGATYSQAIDAIQTIYDGAGRSDDALSDPLMYMLKRTAGRIVRNAATIGGNLMLYLHHIANGTGDPFPSDLATAVYYNSSIDISNLSGSNWVSSPGTVLKNVFDDVANGRLSADDLIISGLTVPLALSYGDRHFCVAQKTALREVNSHSIINSSIAFDWDVFSLNINTYAYFGGVTGAIWTPDSSVFSPFSGQTGLNLQTLSTACTNLYGAAVSALQLASQGRMQATTDEGFTIEYKAQLIAGMLFKAGIALLSKLGTSVPPELASAGEITWGTWPVSSGHQDYAAQDYKAPVGQPYIKATALEQCSGRTHYTHELAYPQGTLHAAFVQSRNALAEFNFRWATAAVAADELSDQLATTFPAFRRLITYADVPVQSANFQGMGADQPLFAVDKVLYAGQAIALILADTEQDANLIAEYVSAKCLAYKPIDWGGAWDSSWQDPILTLEDAIQKGSIFPDTPMAVPYLCHIWQIRRLRSRMDWAGPPAAPADFDAVPTTDTKTIDGSNCIHLVNNQKTGGQAHFYMETQACLAVPADEGRIVVNSSTQSPMEMHQTVSSTLGKQYNKVKIQTRLLGGAFGGKTEQARFTTGPTAVAAVVVDAPVRLAMPRDEDTAMIGKRHALYGVGEIAVDDGSVRSEDKGVIKGMQLAMWADGGAYYDCSFIVTNCIQTRIDNAYMIDNFLSQIDVCRTNTSPNTAMRAFGDIQATNIVENLIDDAAAALNMRAEDLREKNFYQRGDVTPYGQTLTACYMSEVWRYLKQKANFDDQLAKVQAFNGQHKWRKRGIALIPVKYGSGYNFEQLKQSSAIVVVNQADGSVVVHQGGVDMGQGLLTQIRQVAAYVLNIPQTLVHVESPQTDTTPNTSSSGASTGTPYSAEAVKRTCEQLRQQLHEFGYQLLKDNGNDWCKDNGVDFWNYGQDGWNTLVKTAQGYKLIWQNLINLAYANRLPLTATFNANIEHGEFDMPVLRFKQPDEQNDIPGITRAHVSTVTDVQNQFVGFTYSAACSVVEVDILTGETTILRSDLVYDVGWSLNPALDVGQVEGAFVQGIGFLLTENLVTQMDDTGPNEKGHLNTTNTWRYKIPAHVTIPLEFNVSLFPRNDPSVVNIPPDDQGVFSAKEVGEPPLVLANSVFFAIKDAIRASRLERKHSALFNLRAPATVQEVRNACDVMWSELAS